MAKVSGAALVAAVLLVTACDAPRARDTAGPAAPPAPAPPATPAASSAASSCAGGRVSVGPTRRRTVILALAPAVTITSPKGGKLDPGSLRDVRQYRAQVVAQKPVPQDKVYRAFVQRWDDPAAMPALGEVAPVNHSPGDSAVVNRPGRYVQYEGVQAVEAAFSYTCGKATVRGTASSWIGPISGVLGCDSTDRPPDVASYKDVIAACRE
ncbi:hypothetical protein EV385_4077 [Krasilnikovia cinnamomea]|uniref:PknH-like protein n=1 Tax=Krasilnikovia cinnamomea TaxID=349313 RepID=A0A4Q7ZMK3_9ACTN|nr:hypothetical protein [Krasilnikovia cinnamomea]RZU52230.1 hypothetical protein EV385_4077 [Krasilnikovia cinnamomea]